LRGRLDRTLFKQTNAPAGFQPGETPAASPANPPPITITLFQGYLFRVAAEAALAMNIIFPLWEPAHVVEDGKTHRTRCDSAARCTYERVAQRAAAVRIDEASKAEPSS